MHVQRLEDDVDALFQGVHLAALAVSQLNLEIHRAYARTGVLRGAAVAHGAGLEQQLEGGVHLGQVDFKRQLALGILSALVHHGKEVGSGAVKVGMHLDIHHVEAQFLGNTVRRTEHLGEQAAFGLGQLDVPLQVDVDQRRSGFA